MFDKKYTMKTGDTVEGSEEIYKYLLQSDRRIGYDEKYLKRITYIADLKNEKATVIPKREQLLSAMENTKIDKQNAKNMSL